jgi:hypothetical protein
VCFSQLESGIVTKCEWLQTKLLTSGIIFLTLSALKSPTISDDFIQYATSLRVSRGVL